MALVRRNRRYVYAWVGLFVAYSIAARIRVPANDMVNYVAALGSWPPPITIYTVREPVIWFGLPVLGLVLENPILAFVAIDVVTCVITIRALERLDDGSNKLLALAPVLLSSFVFLFGQQNVLRQHVALVRLSMGVVLWARNVCSIDNVFCVSIVYA